MKNIIDLLDHKFLISPLTLRRMAEILDYRESGLPVQFDTKMDCILEGVRVLEGEGQHPVKLTETKVNQIFGTSPNGFNILYNAVIGLSFQEDQKKSDQLSKAVAQLVELLKNQTG